MPDPQTTLLEVSMGYAVSRCLHVMADLGVADALGDAPQTASELAAKTGTNADALKRALRLISSYGIFEAKGDKFVHTPASLLLRSDHPQSMKAYVSFMGYEIDWQSFGLLEHSIQTGKPAVEKFSPGGFWQYMSLHPKLSQGFDQAMTGRSHAMVAGVVASYDFSRFKTIADIGGGRGHLLKAVVEAAPKASGVLFDQPHVVDQVRGALPVRIKVQGGDFFKDEMPQADAYMIMQVIHDWNDEESIAILKAIRRAAPAHAKLLLIEGIVPDDSKPDWIKMLDIFMLALITGRERTLDEFKELMRASGFQFERATKAALGLSILEASAI